MRRVYLHRLIKRVGVGVARVGAAYETVRACVRERYRRETVARNRFAEWKPDNCRFQCGFDPSAGDYQRRETIHRKTIDA